ncbi:MAG: Uma2 family endonuclease [Chloroflexota bacterium]|nr:Uma2 family endonuclease [Chloroflexota bacterium]MDE2684888.1 Uma2 family endonuclease [Chloroflexota bacterium]
MTTQTIELQELNLPRGGRIPEWADPDTFISPDTPPFPDAMHQEPSISDTMTTLRRHLRGRPDWETTLISGNSFLYYNRDNLNDRYSPDCYVAFDVDIDTIWPRNGYMVWSAGKPPDFALEIASKSTGHRDTVLKRRDYARIGIREYWRFDATGGDYHDAPLGGDRLVNGEYQPLPTQTEPDGSIWGYSEVMDLWLVWDSGYLLFWNPSAREFLRNIDAAEDDRQAAEDALAETQETLAGTQEALAGTREALAGTQEALAGTQQRLEASRSAKERALAELEAAQETIRRLREQSDESGPDSGG